jgi:hypothetical protein
LPRRASATVECRPVSAANRRRTCAAGRVEVGPAGDRLDDVSVEGPIDNFDNAGACLQSQIVAVSVVFDARLFAPLFEARQGH